jgi:hypothetical protein
VFSPQAIAGMVPSRAMPLNVRIQLRQDSHAGAASVGQGKILLQEQSLEE